MFPALIRFGIDGSPEMILDLGDTNGWCASYGEVVGVAIDGADRIVLAGTTVHISSQPDDICVARLLSDGSPDPSFSGDGTFRLDSAGMATDVAIDHQGRILVASGDGLTAVRLTASGGLDPTFGEGGVASLRLGEKSEARTIVADPADGVTVAGSATSAGVSGIAVARFDAEGRPDPRFSGTGSQVLGLSGPPAAPKEATDVTLDPFGRLVLSGREGAEGNAAALVARLLPNGALDPSFGEGGQVRLPIASGGIASGVAVDRAGRVLVAGGARSLFHETYGWESFLARLTPGGTLDSSFGGGVVREGSLISSNGGATAVAVDPAGRYLVAARTSKGAFGVARYLSEDEIPVVPRSYRCRGRKVTIVGTRGRDVLRGTKGPDVIVGFRGNDVIRGFGGDDRICGGRGRDRLLGGKGADALFGGSGRDVLRGGPGRDRLHGGRGRDLERQRPPAPAAAR